MKKKASQRITMFQAAAEVLRWMCALGILFLMARMAGGSQISTAPFEQVSSAVLTRLSMDNMKLADNQMVKRLYGVDPASFEEVLLYYPTTNMGAEEMFLAKLSDVSYMGEVQQAVEGRLAVQKKNFDGYGTYQTAMLNASQILVKGNYILFISSESPDQIIEDFENAL